LANKLLDQLILMKYLQYT